MPVKRSFGVLELTVLLELDRLDQQHLQNDEAQNDCLQIPKLAVEVQPNVYLVRLLERVEEARGLNIFVHDRLLLRVDCVPYLKLKRLPIVILNQHLHPLMLVHYFLALCA
jgi:hypothetical protein